MKKLIRVVIAHTYFYMSDKYNINLSSSEYKLMQVQVQVQVWDKMYPSKAWECKHKKLINYIQGNDDKFVTEE